MISLVRAPIWGTDEIHAIRASGAISCRLRTTAFASRFESAVTRISRGIRPLRDTNSPYASCAHFAESSPTPLDVPVQTQKPSILADSDRSGAEFDRNEAGFRGDDLDKVLNCPFPVLTK